MKKKITAVAIAISLVHASCYGAVSVKSDSIEREFKIVTVSGTAESGEVVAYSLTIKGEDKNDYTKIYSVGDTVADENGAFSVKFEFPERADTGTYTLYIGSEEGKTESIDIDYINYVKAINAMQTAKSADDIAKILEEGSEYEKALIYLGFDTDTYHLLDDSGVVCENMYKNGKLSEASAEEMLKVFNTYIGMECINEGIEGGVEFINPTFEGTSYAEIESETQKKYLTDRVYGYKYDTIDEFETKYRMQNILYKFESVSVGSFADLADKYKSELGISGEDFYVKFESMPASKQNTVVKQYFEYTEKNAVETSEDFAELLKKAVNVAPSGGSSTGGGGGGGSSRGSVSNGGYAAYESEGTPYNSESEEVYLGFSDIESVEWAKEAINELAGMEIVNGTAPGIFEPDANVTREQMVKMILLSMGIDADEAETPFDDVPEGEWYTSFVAEAYSRGIINGISREKFGVGENLTRQDLAVMVVRAARANGIEGYDTVGISEFADRDIISDYAKEAVDVLYLNGEINGKGDNCFKPFDKCTRAEAAKIIYNVFFE